MRDMGLQGMRRGPKKVRTTVPDSAAARPPDLVERDFTASALNRLWVVDFTYVPTWAGMAFTAFVTDVCSRRIVGWRTASRMPTELPLDALEMALWTRAREGRTDADGRLEGLIQHSDAGSQYVAFRYTERLTAAGAVASIGTVGDSYDNALAESVIGLYKNECVKHDGPFRTVDDLELATLSWVHWFNHQRLHSSIGDALLRGALFSAADQARKIDPQIAAAYHRLMVAAGKHHTSATCTIAATLLTRAVACWRAGTPYVIRDTDGTERTAAEGRAIVAEHFTVPTGIRTTRSRLNGTGRRSKESPGAPSTGPSADKARTLIPA